MDKVIRVIQGANEVLTCGQKVLSKLDFRPKNLVGREREKKKKRGRKVRERSSTFSLGFPVVESAVFGGLLLRAMWWCLAPRGMFGCILNYGELPYFDHTH